MKKWLSFLFYIVLGIFVLLIIAAISANFIIKNKIERALTEDLPENILLNYDDLEIQSLKGTVVLQSVDLIVKNKKDGKEHTFLSAKEFRIDNFSYKNYLFNKKIQLDDIVLDSPKLLYYKDLVEAKDSVTESKSSGTEREIHLNNIKFLNGEFTIIDKERDSVFLYASNVSFLLSDVTSSLMIQRNKIPFEYVEGEISGDSLFIKAGVYENAAFGKFRIGKENAEIHDIHFYTKYSISRLNRIIPHERDHYNLKVESLKVMDYKFFIGQEKLESAGAKKVEIGNTHFEVYRDKTVKKDTTFKPLYNRALRQLPFDLAVDSVLIATADIQYTERHQTENNGGFLTFKNLEAKIGNVGNVYEEEVDAAITALFMDETPFSARWKLNVHSPVDHFSFRAEVQKFNAARMDVFLGPNLNANLVGSADHTFFTIDGNNENSKTDVKIKYSDLKVNLLKKENKDKKQVLSALVNIVIPKNSSDHGKEFNDGTGTADRNKNQSVFNQLWISLESALKDAMLPGVVKKIAQ